MRRAINTCQKEPEDKQSAVHHFHRNICQKANEGDPDWAFGPLDSMPNSLSVFVNERPTLTPVISRFERKEVVLGGENTISFTEQLKYDRRVVVRFQPNAWCDEDIMRFWIKNCWKPSRSGAMHLVLDIHLAQKTEEIQDILKAECNTSVTFHQMVVPLLFNQLTCNYPFKSGVERQATQHM